MSAKVIVTVLSSVALGAAGIGGGFLYKYLTKPVSIEDKDESSGKNPGSEPANGESVERNARSEPEAEKAVKLAE